MSETGHRFQIRNSSRLGNEKNTSLPESEKIKKGAFSVLIPFYNEALFLERTLKSWLNQERLPDQIVCVDNKSTDDSMALARCLLEPRQEIDTIFLLEENAGKIFALDTGMMSVNCEFVVLADADTYYPPHYLQRCGQLFQKSGSRVSSLMALPEYSDGDTWVSKFKRGYFLLAHRFAPKHCFTGGYGHIHRTQALKSAGGFNEKIWPYVLLDHEIVFRLMCKGKAVYDMGLWCKPSLRRERRERFRWTLWERMVYMITPHIWQRWFFYRFLGPRLKKRGMTHLVLREKSEGAPS